MRPLRNRDPSIYRLITIRTGEARLWITPNRKIRRLIGGIVARYQEIFGIVIYAYCFLGNHYHMLIKAPGGNSDEFLENVNREISRRLNFAHRREGKLWARRYDDQQVLGEDDLLAAFLYINTNPTRHGLIEDSSAWPGLTSYSQAITGKGERFSFFHYSKETHEEQITVHTLKLSPLPQHARMSQRNRSELLRNLLAERTRRLVAERNENAKGFLGLKSLQATIVGEIPRNVSKSKRPICYTLDMERRREFRETYRYRRMLYRDASLHYRLGKHDVEFPAFSFKPPLHRVPRSVPFKPLTPAEINLVA